MTSLISLPNQPIVLSVRADPDPHDSIVYIRTQRAMLQSGTHRPQLADTLEM